MFSWTVFCSLAQREKTWSAVAYHLLRPTAMPLSIVWFVLSCESHEHQLPFAQRNFSFVVLPHSWELVHSMRVGKVVRFDSPTPLWVQEYCMIYAESLVLLLPGVQCNFFVHREPNQNVSFTLRLLLSSSTRSYENCRSSFWYNWSVHDRKNCIERCLRKAVRCLLLFAAASQCNNIA